MWGSITRAAATVVRHKKWHSNALKLNTEELRKEKRVMTAKKDWKITVL